MKHIITLIAALLPIMPTAECRAEVNTKTVRVFIFAGQSNMVGSDSKAEDIQRFPPFAGLDRPQDKVLFSYSIGREEKRSSEGWVPLRPVSNVVGPELQPSKYARTQALEQTNASF